MKNDEQKNFEARVKYVSKMVFLVIMGTLLATFVIYRFADLREIVNDLIYILNPIFYGIGIAYLLDPICRGIFSRLYPLLKEKKKGEKIARALSITFGMIIGIAIVTILIVLIIPGLTDSINKIVEEAPKQVDNFINWLRSVNRGDTELVASINSILERVLNMLENWVETDLFSTMGDIVTAITSGVIDVVMFVLNFFIGIVVAVYVLFDKQKFLGQSKKLVYAVFKPGAADTIIETARHGHKIFGGFLYGKILDSAIVGLITFIVLTILRTPYALLVSVIIGVTNIIPFFGPFIGGIPSAILILLADPLQGLYFIIFVIIMQQIDGNIIGPKILGNTTGISEFWVTFALLLFGGIFGFLGMILGVPAFAVAYYVAVLLINGKLKRKQLPLDSNQYREAKDMAEIKQKQKMEEEQ